MYYDSEQIFINSKTGALAKVAAIDACIDVLLTQVLAACGKASTQEYMLNDGQTVIKKIYRSTSDVIKAVTDLRTLKSLYMQDLNSRAVRLVDAKNLTRRGR